MTKPGGVTPFLMFTGCVQEAIDHYLELIGDAEFRVGVSWQLSLSHPSGA